MDRHQDQVSIYRRENGQLYLRWHEGGRCYRRSLQTTSESVAESYRLSKILELRGHETSLTQSHGRPDCQTFSHFLPDYLKWFKQARKSSYYRASKILLEEFEPLFGKLRLDEIDAGRVARWQTQRATEFSKRKKKDTKTQKFDPTIVRPSTVNKELRTLKAMLNTAVKWKALDKNPCEDAEFLDETDDTPIRFYNDDQLARLYAVHEERRWWWQLYVNTGMRRGEGANLRAEDIHDGRVTIVSSFQRRTKSGKTRQVPLSAGAREALEHLPKEGQLIRGMNLNSITRHFEHDAKAAKIGGRLHDLRHTFCSRLVLAGKPARLIQAWAGHASITTTERYLQVDPRQMKGLLDDFRL